MLPYLIIPAFLALALLIPVGMDVSFDADGLRVCLRLWQKLIKLLPKKKQDNSLSGKNKKKQKLSFSEWQDIIKPALKLIGKMELSTLKLHYISAGPDPYRAVSNYNKAYVLASSVYPFVRAENEDIVIRTDFDKSKSVLELYASVTTRLYRLFLSSDSLGLAVIKVYINRKVIHGK